MKWCDEVQRQIFEGILTHLSNYMLNWPKIICHPKLRSQALALFFPILHSLIPSYVAQEKLRIVGFRAQKLTLNGMKASEKLIASNKQHDC